MRILRLDLDGFKSFGKPTSLDFTATITGVVGPNGCGKSNVVDAVRWVLGEMSRKAIRAKSSTDVIFSGSSNRKAARRAEVSITFDNTCGTLPYSTKTVKVTRRLHRNGDSEYLINDEHAKMRDVRGLFQGTGAAMSAYSIMEQGKMDRMLTSNPDERRSVFEEAAGIGQMRKQQKLAEGKLLVVDQNIERLKDVLSEVRTRLRRIKTQASRALRYTELKERAKLLNVQVALVEFHKHNAKREELLRAISQAGAREGAVQADLARVRMELEDAQNRLANARHEERRLSERIHKMQLEIQNENNARERALGRINSLKQLIERARETSERIRTQTANLNARRQTIDAAHQEVTNELEELTRELAELKATETNAATEAHEIENSLTRARSTLLEAVRVTNESLNERTSVSADIRSSEHRLEAMARRSESLGLRRDASQESATALEAELTTIESTLAELRENLAASETENQTRANTLETARRNARNLELKRGARVERLSVLTAMNEAREGVDDNVAKLLDDANKRESFGVRGALAENARIDLGFAAALERVLGPYANALCVDSLEHAHDLFDWLSARGSVNQTIIAMDSFSTPRKAPAFPSGKGVIGGLIDEIQFDAAFAPVLTSILGDVLLVADRSVARRLMRKGATGFRMVTPTGEMFELPGCFALPMAEGDAGVISRVSEMDRLSEEIASLDSDVAEAETALEAAQQAVSEGRARESELRSNVYDAGMDVARAKMRAETAKRELAAITEELATMDSERGELNARVTEDRARLSALEAAIEEAETARRDSEATLAELTDKAQGAREALHDARDKLSNLRVTEATLRQKLAQSSESLRGIDSALKSYADDVARSVTECEAHEKEIRELEHRANASVDVQAELERECKELEARRDNGDDNLSRHQAEVNEYQTKAEALQAKLYAEKESVQQSRIDENGLFLQMDQIRRRMAENFNVDIDTKYRDFDANRDQVNEREVRDELENLNEQLRRLGNVNMEAMEELKEAEERSTFYGRQEADLLRAKRTLSDAIARIERETKRMFIDTFEAVRSNFQRLFRRMFGGGSADILLTNPEEPLASGVDIIAKPPGKEALSISMRSGGERAMISVALMFAIYEINPAPYAILDEVDAPLDEANVDRFCSVVRDYADVSQFIIITHHKKTMAACDALYGVTMQEPGTSTPVSVDLGNTTEAEPALAGAVG